MKETTAESCWIRIYTKRVIIFQFLDTISDHFVRIAGSRY
jgi:hypothetical protein